MINREFLNNILSINYQNNNEFGFLGLSNTDLPNSLSFFDDERYLKQLNENRNISGVFVHAINKEKISSEKNIIIVEDPRWCYFTLYNDLAKKNKRKFSTIIDQSSNIHSTAFVAETNVIIGKNCIIHPNVTILDDVEIGDNCIIQSGTVIGSEGFEYKKTNRGILGVYHDGKVIIENNVEIGANNAIAKGFSYRQTIIKEYTKTDNLVHIAHAVQIGKRCLLTASAMIAGSVTIEDDVWIGPNASISSGIHINEKAFITIGAVVTKDVMSNEKVSGNFAIPHDIFLNFIKKLIKQGI
jgi:UDP-3-O-[3-hydroxymyristoyl] glucosamine N-acyltransferase